jgi:MFS family permease
MAGLFVNACLKPPAMTVYRNVASLTLAVMLLQAAAGILSVSTPLALQYMGASALGVGAVAAAFSAGFMLGAWYAPDVVRQVGHIRAYSAGAAIYAAGILAMGLAFDPWAWAPLRFAQGAGSAVMFAAAESWIADSTPRGKRGSVMGLYQLLIKVSMSLGPLLVVDHAPEDVKPFIWAGMLMTLALVPLCATRRAQPVLPDPAARSLASVMKMPPAALAGAIAAGFANTGVMSQMPLYAAELRPQDANAAAASLSIAAWMGGVLTQWPAGLLSDRVDRRLIVAILGSLAGAAALMLFTTAGEAPWSATVMLAAIWGGGALSFYSISASYATDRCEPGEIAQVMSGMLFVWATASVIGPVVLGAVADTPLGQPGVFAVAAGAYVLLCLANIWRIAARRAPWRRNRFSPIGNNSVVAGEVASESSRPSQAE